MREKSDDFSRAKSRALYILGKADRTEYEIRRSLGRDYAADTVDEVIDCLKEYGYIDDRRFAGHYFEIRSRDRGLKLVAHELVCVKGVDKDIVEEAMSGIADADGGWDEGGRIRSWMLRKNIDPDTADPKEIVRFYRFLQRRGFSSSGILNELRKSGCSI